MCVWVKFYGGSKLRLNTVRHVTSIGPSITPVSTGITLLDEADVFMQERTLEDLERNKLVSSKFQ